VSPTTTSITINHDQQLERIKATFRQPKRRNITAPDVNRSQTLGNPDACRSSWVEYAFFDWRHTTTTCGSEDNTALASGCATKTERHDGVIIGNSPMSYSVGDGLPRVKYKSISITHLATSTTSWKVPVTTMAAPECIIQNQHCTKQWLSMWSDLKGGMASVFAGREDDRGGYMLKCFNDDNPREQCVASWAEKQGIKTRDWFGGCSKPSFDKSEERFCPFFGWFPISPWSQHKS
jgi:hypothetical protein